MRRIPRYLKVLATRTLTRTLKGRLEGLQLQAAIDTALATLPFQEKLLVREGAMRSDALNRQLAWAMAFVAGAVNAGGFLAVGHYTSHMTGTTSLLADKVALGDVQTALAALAMMVSFIGGAFICAMLISLGQRRRMRSRYALTLLLESALLLVFGLMGARLETEVRFTLPSTVLLLSFIMGLHNAVTSIISGAEVRTTHVTGTVTDIGIELARLSYMNRHARAGRGRIVANRRKLVLLLLLLVSFIVGGITGALAFKHVGFKATLPLAAFLCFLAARPVLLELRLLLHRLRRQWE